MYIRTILFLLFFCIFLSDAKADEFEIVDGVLRFSGSISDASAKDILGYIENGGRVIVINSPGGDAMAGLRIAKEIHRKNVSVVVDRYCFSSCANYLFIAATTKVVKPGAILGFHGGLSAAKPMLETAATLPLATESEIRQANEIILKQYANELDFFRSIGFNTSFFKLSDLPASDQPRYIEITSLGKVVQTFDLAHAREAKELMDTLLARNQESGWRSPFKLIPAAMYFPSKKTLVKFGAQGIALYSYPANDDVLKAITKHAEVSFGLTGLVTYGDFREEPAGSASHLAGRAAHSDQHP